MALQDAYPNLPGMVASINDGGLTLPTPVLNTTQSVLMLGLATDGPNNTPIQISSIGMGEKIFGVTPKPVTAAGVLTMQKSITARVYELFQAGCTDIRLVRVGGSFAVGTLVDSTTASNDLILTGNYPGTKYNALASAVVPTFIGASAASATLVDATTAANNLILTSNSTGATGNGLSVSVINVAGVGSVKITPLVGGVQSFAFTATSAYSDLLTAINASTLAVTATQGPVGSPGALFNVAAFATTAFSGGSNGVAASNLNITTLDGIVHAFPFTATSVYADLIDAITSSTLNITASQNVAGDPGAPVNLAAQATTPFSGGDDGANYTDAQYSDALTAGYRQLENYAVSCVVPCGAYLQPSCALDANASPTIANAQTGDTVFYGQNLSQFVARMSVNTQSCIGIIALAPLLNPTYTNTVNRTKQLIGTYTLATGLQVTAPTAYTFEYATDYSPGAGPQMAANLTTGAAVDTGYLLNITVGEIVATGAIGGYIADLAPSYAGTVVTLPAQSAATNKVIANVTALVSIFGASVLNALAGLRFVMATAFQRDGSVRVLADNTYGVPGSDFKFLSTLRITYAAVEQVRNATASFIGMPSNPANLNSMGTAINGALTNMKTAGALIDYQYALNATTADQIAGNMEVTLALVPALQIRKIIVTVSLKPAAAISS